MPCKVYVVTEEEKPLAEIAMHNAGVSFVELPRFFDTENFQTLDEVRTWWNIE